MSIESISIPNYTRKQERFNSFSHFLGILIAIIIAILAVSSLVHERIDKFLFSGLLVFSITAFCVYAISGTYHYLDKDNILKKIFRVIDHCAIYLLIAGTYTPVGLCVSLNNLPLGIAILITEWACAVLGIILKGFFFDKTWAKGIGFSLYIIMGWLLLFTGGFIYINKLAFFLILAGGIVYTVGAILYGIAKKNLNYHSVFHVFVLISTIVQTIGVFYLF